MNVHAVAPQGHTYLVCSGFADYGQAVAWIAQHQWRYTHSLVVMP